MDERHLFAEAIMGPLTGITITLIIGLVIATYFYFRSKERQMMIERGLSPEQITELFRSKRNPYTWLKLGVIIIGTGLGVGLGVVAAQSEWNEGLVPLFIITFIGIGFVGAFFISRKFEKEDEALQKKTEL